MVAPMPTYLFCSPFAQLFISFIGTAEQLKKKFKHSFIFGL
jgi:hypothetical protein